MTHRAPLPVTLLAAALTVAGPGLAPADLPPSSRSGPAGGGTAPVTRTDAGPAATPGSQERRTAPEYGLKAAFLLNFVKFVRWPAGAFDGPESPYEIVVVGDDPFGPALEGTLAGETVRGRSFRIRRVPEPSRVEGAHVLFVSRSAEDDLGELLRRLADRPVLTVADREELAHRGLIVGFYLEGGRVRFAINHPRARTVGLEISSRLLSLARIVRSASESGGRER